MSTLHIRMASGTNIPVHTWDERTTSSGSFRMESWEHRQQDPRIPASTPARVPWNHVFHRRYICTRYWLYQFESAGHEFHLVQANSVHMMMVREESASGISLMFSSDFADQQVLPLLPFGTENLVIKTSSEDYQRALQLLLMIQTEYTQQAPGYMQIIRNYFNSFLAAGAHSCTNNWRNTTSHTGYLPQVHRSITERPGEMETVESIAEALHVSPKHLIEVVKSQSGQTPLHMIPQLSAHRIKAFAIPYGSADQGNRLYTWLHRQHQLQQMVQRENRLYTRSLP